jgi:photosystem II stability/assembly factor-like uncharacterized protein
MYRSEKAVHRLLVGTAEGVSVLERNGGDWTVKGRKLEGMHVSSMLVEPTQGGVFAGIHRGGVYFSADQGETWEARDNGIAVEHVFTLALDDRGGKTVLYAGTEPARLFRSEDYGQSWHELPALREVPDTDKWTFPAPPHTAHVKTMAFDPRDDQVILVGIEQGALLKTTDGGATWRELSSFSKADDEVYRDVHRVLLRPSNPDELFMTGGMGLYHSTDQGHNFEHVTDRDFRIGYPDQMVFSPRDDRLMFMAGSSHHPGSWRQSHHAESTVIRTRDGGKTWDLANHGLPEGMRANLEAMTLVAWPDGYAVFAANTDGEVYLTENEGESWTRIASGLAPISKGGHYHPLQATAA